MQGGEFEKQVQQKMEELKFSPSESVWTNVEKEIKKEKKRRVPVFWLFFPLGLAAAIGLYFLVTPKNTATKSIQVSSNKQASSTADKAITAPANTGSGNSRAKTSGNIINPNKENISNNAASSSSENKTITGSHKNNTGLVSNTGKEKPGAGRQSGTGAVYKKEVHKISQGKKSKTTEPAIVQNAPAPGYAENNTAAGDKAANNNTAIEQDPANADKNISPEDSTVSADLANSKADSSSSKPIAAKTDSAVARQAVAKHTKTKKTYPWKIGLTGAAGIGAIHQGLFNPATVPSPNLDNLLSNAAYAPVYRPSDIRPGASFSAGVFVQKQLSRKLSLSIGVNYHYYSTSIRTGRKVDSSSSLQTATYSLQARPNYAYYGNGEMNKYTSRYHFIELPVALQYQLNRSKKWPLTWEAGFAVSELLSTDALYFNYSTGVYYRNNDSFNKTQLSGNTALMIGFSHHKTRFTVGPQLQYGFTNLLSNKSTGKEHLFFTGLKFTIVPNWK